MQPPMQLSNALSDYTCTTQNARLITWRFVWLAPIEAGEGADA